jgi:AcrR family transcriptional regulator
MPFENVKFETLALEKRTRILNASISEFSNNEYESASMNSIVQEAKISKGSLFNYFVNKSELYKYIYNIAVQKVKKYLKKVRDESTDLPFEERLCLIVEKGINFIEKNPKLSKMYFKLRFSGNSPNQNQILNDLQKMSELYLENILKSAIFKREIDKNINIKQSVFFLDTILNKYLNDYHRLNNTENSSHFTPEDWTSGIASFFAKGFK